MSRSRWRSKKELTVRIKNLSRKLEHTYSEKLNNMLMNWIFGFVALVIISSPVWNLLIFWHYYRQLRG